MGSTTAILTATALIAWGGCGWENKEKKENEQGISPLFVHVNCTWSQNQSFSHTCCSFLHLGLSPIRTKVAEDK